jgi:hypothetical protein
MNLPKLNTLEPQEGKLGRAFRQVMLTKDVSKPPLWVKGEYKHHWIYTFIYLDDGSCFQIEIDYHDKFFDKKTI